MGSRAHGKIGDDADVLEQRDYAPAYGAKERLFLQAFSRASHLLSCGDRIVRDSGYMSHFSAGLRLGLAVEVEFDARVGQGGGPVWLAVLP